jgi:hypothetical protein
MIPVDRETLAHETNVNEESVGGTSCHTGSKPRSQTAIAMAMAIHDGGGGRQDMMDWWGKANLGRCEEVGDWWGAGQWRRRAWALGVRTRDLCEWK